MASAVPAPIALRPVKRDKQLVARAEGLPVDVANLHDYPAAKLGRPRVWDEEVARKVLMLIVEGETVHAAMEAVGLSWFTFYHWTRLHEHFAQAVVLARVGLAHRYEREFIQIADTSDDDVTEVESKGGRTYQKYNNEVTRRSQLRMEARKFLMEKHAPHIYGQRQLVEHSGEVTTTTNVDVRLSLGTAASPEARRLANQCADRRDEAMTGNSSADGGAVAEALPVTDPQPLVTPPPCPPAQLATE